MKKPIFIIFLWATLLSSSYATWANLQDLSIKRSAVKTININSNGTLEEVAEITSEILNEAGRTPGASDIIYYDGDSEKLEILEAKTIYKGKEYKIDKNLIEDKPLASSYEGFDQKRQILLAFPKTEVGAKLYFKYKLTLLKPPLDNFYAKVFYFGRFELSGNAKIKVNSKLPLYILVNDPEGHLKINEKKAKDLYQLEIILKRPIYKVVVNEPEPYIVDPRKFTWVSVSSLKNWQDFAKEYGKNVAQVLTQKLPPAFVRISEIAKEKARGVDQINAVTSLLNDRIRYLGDWRSVGGRLVPRDLALINKTQLGDCKDFSAATAAILNDLGYQAQIVAVSRGVIEPSLCILPSFEACNHAMVKVTDEQGKIYWIDPTNFESMAGRIFPDIAGKMALILDPENPGYEKIPEIGIEQPSSILKREFNIKNNKIIETGNLLLKNEETLGLIGSALKFSEEMIKNAIFYALADYTHLDAKNKKIMKLPRLNSRIVTDISIDYAFEREHDILPTNVGPALMLTTGGSIAKIYNISQDNVADAFISNFPHSALRQTTVKNVKIKNLEFLNKELRTPWLAIKRVATSDKNNSLQIKETITLYKNIIPSTDFKKPEFINLKNWLKSNCKDIVVVFEPVATN